MPSTFSRTVRAMTTDSRGTSTLVAGVASLLLILWLAWFFFASQTRYEVSTRARIAVMEEAHRVEAPIAGRIARVRYRLGERVDAGEVLMELDPAEATLALEEARARAEGLAPQITALQGQIEAMMAATQATGAADAAASSSARARLQEASARLTQAENELSRLSSLPARYTTAVELERAQSDVATARAAKKGARREVQRLGQVGVSASAQDQVKLEALKGELAELNARKLEEEAGARATAQRLEWHKVRAPVAGRVAEVSRLRPGEVVEIGERICDIVPEGELQIIATFDARTALGRLEPGQLARVHLDGFSWSRYGSLSGEVVRISEGPTDGELEAEITLSKDGPDTLPRQHGLMATVEVATEEQTPAALFLGLIGEQLQPVAQPPGDWSP